MPIFYQQKENFMLEDTLKDRKEQYGNFHTHANLTQTLFAVLVQHYTNAHTVEGNAPANLPNFMLEGLHMICHKLARIVNGNPYYDDSWVDIAGYSTLVADILQQAKKLNEQKNTEQTTTQQEQE